MTPLFIASGFAPPKTLAPEPTKPAKQQVEGGGGGAAMGSDTETEKKKTPLALAPIAKPLAGKKLCKRTLKLVRRGS